jgi:hypothetical protein
VLFYGIQEITFCLHFTEVQCLYFLTCLLYVKELSKIAENSSATTLLTRTSSAPNVKNQPVASVVSKQKPVWVVPVPDTGKLFT